MRREAKLDQGELLIAKYMDGFILFLIGILMLDFQEEGENCLFESHKAGGGRKSPLLRAACEESQKYQER